VLVSVVCGLLCRATDECSTNGRVFSFNMLALVEHLEQQSTHNRLASYFNIDSLKYRVGPSFDTLKYRVGRSYIITLDCVGWIVFSC